MIGENADNIKDRSKNQNMYGNRNEIDSEGGNKNMNGGRSEIWDIYTRDRELTGRTHLRGEKLKEGEYHLVVHVCIFNSQGQLLIQQRQPFKRGWPNMWDLSVGGSAISGDTSYKAAERETFEELGLKIDLSNTRPCFTINFDKGFDDYYLIERDIEIDSLQLQEEEVKQVKWVDKEQILKMRDEGTMIPYWFLDRLFQIKGQYGSLLYNNPMIRMEYASMNHMASWMSLIEIMKWNFPGLETEDKINSYRNTVIKNIDRKSAVCALDGNTVIGVSLFSVKHNMLSFLAVHPEYRRQGIAEKIIRMILPELDQSKDIMVETFREEDEKGEAPRGLYQSLGFVPDELCYFEEKYPMQRFVLKGRSRDE